MKVRFAIQPVQKPDIHRPVFDPGLDDPAHRLDCLQPHQGMFHPNRLGHRHRHHHRHRWRHPKGHRSACNPVADPDFSHASGKTAANVAPADDPVQSAKFPGATAPAARPQLLLQFDHMLRQGWLRHAQYQRGRRQRWRLGDRQKVFQMPNVHLPSLGQSDADQLACQGKPCYRLPPSLVYHKGNSRPRWATLTEYFWWRWNRPRRHPWRQPRRPGLNDGARRGRCRPARHALWPGSHP